MKPIGFEYTKWYYEISKLAERLGIDIKPFSLDAEQIVERIWNRDLTCKTRNDAATAAAHAKTMTSVGT